MPRPLKPIKTKWWTPPDNPRTRLALTGKPEGKAKSSDDDDAVMIAAFVATGII